jgi:hypothetical protein
MNGQSSMAAIVMAVVLIVFLAVFMLTTSEPASTAEAKLEYRKLFATNTLLSILNTETEDCGTMGDMLKASYFGGGKCESTAFDERIEGYMDYVLLSSGHTDYDWLIEAAPKDFEGEESQWGNPAVTEKKGYWDARTMLTWGGSVLDVKIYMKTK